MRRVRRGHLDSGRCRAIRPQRPSARPRRHVGQLRRRRRRAHLREHRTRRHAACRPGRRRSAAGRVHGRGSARRRGHCARRPRDGRSQQHARGHGLRRLPGCLARDCGQPRRCRQPFAGLRHGDGRAQRHHVLLGAGHGGGGQRRRRHPLSARRLHPGGSGNRRSSHQSIRAIGLGYARQPPEIDLALDEPAGSLADRSCVRGFGECRGRARRRRHERVGGCRHLMAVRHGGRGRRHGVSLLARRGAARPGGDEPAGGHGRPRAHDPPAFPCRRGADHAHVVWRHGRRRLEQSGALDTRGHSRQAGRCRHRQWNMRTRQPRRSRLAGAGRHRHPAHRRHRQNRGQHGPGRRSSAADERF